MATLTIRKVDDGIADKLKSIAKEHNRSVEAEVRSVLEDYTAGFLAHHEANDTNFYAQLREFMEREGIEGFDDLETPPRDAAHDPVRDPFEEDLT